MTAVCHPIPASAAQSYFAQAKQAFCDDRPGETPAQGAARTKRMVHTVLGLEPRDGLEYMIATLIEGQYQVLMNAMATALKDETANPRALSGIAALSRVFVSLLRESRTARKRPLEEPAAPTQTEPPAGTEPQHTAEPAQPPAAPEPAPNRTNVLTLADFPSGPSPEDDARLAQSLAAFQKAHAEAKAALADSDRKLSRTATGR